MHGISLPATVCMLSFVAHLFSCSAQVSPLPEDYFTPYCYYGSSSVDGPWSFGQAHQKYTLCIYSIIPGVLEEADNFSWYELDSLHQRVHNRCRSNLLKAMNRYHTGDLVLPEETDTRNTESESPGVELPPAPVLSPDPEDLDDPVDEVPDSSVDFKPSRSQLADLVKMHDNMGHPSNEDFARILKLGSVKSEVWKWVRHNFECEHCKATKLPRAKRPTAVPRTYAFNHIIGADLVVIKNLDGHPQNWLNVLCWGTSYQQFRI